MRTVSNFLFYFHPFLTTIFTPRYILPTLLIGLSDACTQKPVSEKQRESLPSISPCKLIVLGTTQDGGSPHIGCNKTCCEKLFHYPDSTRKVVSLGIVDLLSQKSFLFEATPDIAVQLKQLKNYAPFMVSDAPNGIFLSHAHIGHYAGLMYLGKEAMNSKGVPVYTMPRMNRFLKTNGPWSQLIQLNNIELIGIREDSVFQVTPNINVVAIKVPHRDEYSETVAYKVIGPKKTILFVPDIDKWDKWHLNIEEEVKKVDYAFLDATFYDANEVGNRNIKEIPHPLVIESMNKFKMLEKKQKAKIYFIHFNHSNPLLNATSQNTQFVIEQGFHLAKLGQVFEL